MWIGWKDDETIGSEGERFLLKSNLQVVDLGEEGWNKLLYTHTLSLSLSLDGGDGGKYLPPTELAGFISTSSPCKGT
jgi:hypothetical protein